MGREVESSEVEVEALPTPPKFDLNIDWSQVNLEALQLPEGEDFDIKSEDEEEELEVVESETGFGNVIVVDNLPVVPPEKFEKLQTVAKKIFGQIGLIREGGLWMPVNKETQKTNGYAFIEYATPQEAQAAREQMDGYKLDKAHVFKVSMFDDFEKYARVPDQYAPPPLKEYTPSENLQWFAADERGRDQFVIRFASETEVYWNDARAAKPDPVYRRTFWTESFVQWSPLGSYLATIHRQGAAIWAGSSWQRIMRFAHPQVRLIDFSPGERFLVTYSSHEPANPRDTQKVVLNVFDVRTGKSMREFKGAADDFATGGAGGVAGVQWPVFRWAGGREDKYFAHMGKNCVSVYETSTMALLNKTWAGGREDKYFARMGKNCVSVYETSTMALLDKKSLKADHVHDFTWSPAEPILAMYIPESNGGNQPARVSLVAIPSREELRQKNLFSVSECRMAWQSAGEYLAVKVDRYTKTKKTTYSGFELFRIKERDIPIEVLELENKNDKVIDFAWEPKGHRFAVIHGDGPKPDVSIYTMKPAGAGGAGGVVKVAKLTTLKGKQANTLCWSPMGRFLVLAGLKGFNGQFEFFNVDELETMGTGEHFMATDVEWDPTGRYLATAVTSVHQMENGFHIWSFSGRLLYQLPRDRFMQFLWRPRPPSLLPAEKEAEVSKNLRKYSRKYEVEDEEAGAASSAAEVERRRMVLDEWRQWQAEWRHIDEQEEKLRAAIRGGVKEEEEEYKAEEVEVEEIIDIQEEIERFE
ncbi:unnamed protein product [Closterium sp. NIES-64]|nr:unnamed protein product [Closterium sp. NIES-64]